MTFGLWLKFPKPAPIGDPFIDSLPDALPQPKPDETQVEIRAVLILKNSEGPLPSQVGCMMDVIADIARAGGAVAGRLDAGWDEQQRLLDCEPRTETGIKP